MLVDAFQVVNLITFVDDFVKEESSEATLKENSLVESLADNHADEGVHLPPVLVRFVRREQIRVELPVDFSLDKEAVLGVENLLCQLGHELFKKATCVDSHLFNAVRVDKENLEALCWVEVRSAPKYIERIFKDEITAHAEKDLLGIAHLGGSLLRQHIREDLGAHFEIVDPGHVRYGDLTDAGRNLVEWLIRCLCCHALVDDPEVRLEQLKSVVSTHQIGQSLLEASLEELTEAVPSLFALKYEICDLV